MALALLMLGGFIGYMNGGGTLLGAPSDLEGRKCADAFEKTIYEGLEYDPARHGEPITHTTKPTTLTEEWPKKKKICGTGIFGRSDAGVYSSADVEPGTLAAEEMTNDYKDKRIPRG
jgi:hypothetical protein